MPLDRIDQMNLQDSMERAIDRSRERAQFQAEVAQLAAEGKISFFKGLLYFAISIVGGTALGWTLGLVTGRENIPLFMIGGFVLGLLFGPRILAQFLGRQVLVNCRRTFQITIPLAFVVVVLYAAYAVYNS